MSDRVRVKDPVSGHEFTTTPDFAESCGLTVLEEPAVDSFGRDLPAKHSAPPEAPEAPEAPAATKTPKAAEAAKTKEN
jgi:hypothetical protein